MSIPLLIIIGVLLVYIVVSYLYCHAMYLSKPKEAETVKKIKKLYYILTVIFAFIILSKFAFEQSIKDLSFDSSFIIDNYIKPIIEKKTLTIEIILSFSVFLIFLFNVHFLPLLLSQSSKLTKNKFLSVYYNPKIIYNILPDNKVRNCIYSKVKQNQNECVVDLIDTNTRIYPVGRLDYDTTGVLLLTNDGELANGLMHPTSEVDKTYIAKVEGILTGYDVKRLKSGLVIDGYKTSRCHVKVRSVDKKKNRCIVEIVIHEGRNHQVKKMIEAVGKKVIKLKRERYAIFGVEGLKAGDYRRLSNKEIAILHSMIKKK